MTKSNDRNLTKFNQEMLHRTDQKGMSMRLRLFLFLVFFLNTIMLGVLLILFTSGVFKADLWKHRQTLEGELTRTSKEIYLSFGALSMQTIDLAEKLSMSIERNLKEQGSSVVHLQENPQLLQHLLESELDKLTGALEKSRGSGAFILLDATVNPSLPGSQDSRACIYLRNLEPNIVHGMATYPRYSYGPMSIARDNQIPVLPQWQMEMNIREMPGFTSVMAIAKEQTLPLSRLYNWSKATTLPGGSEQIMLCTAPLIGSEGTVFGVCGFEISEMLFKLTYFPKLESYDYLFCLLSPIEENTLQLSGALFAGSFAASSAVPELTNMDISSDSDTFTIYQQPEKESYAGLHQLISLYPTDSAYEDEQWTVALMMPQQGLNTLLYAKNRYLTAGLVVLILVNIFLALFISHKYTHPVTQALQQLKHDTSTKTNIPEIDDLIQFLAAQDKYLASEEKKELPIQEHSTLYQEFIKNITLLSAAEKLVFDLYVKGHTAKEIAEILCLSINTIKTHNRRIYMKLHVTSRKELMLYIQMMEEERYREGRKE